MNKSKTISKVWMVNTLLAADKNEFPSRYHSNILVDAGFLNIIKVPTNGRGRPFHTYELTGKSRSYIAFAKKWNATKHLFQA